MTHLYLPQTGQEITDFPRIQAYLSAQGVELDRWEASFPLCETDTQERVLEAYAHKVRPYMETHGFKAADVINVHPGTPNLEALRAKFLQEHTHSENEVRFFVDGSGVFWFHFEDGQVARLVCIKGDFLSVPKGAKHWFDLAPEYFVKAIRIFTNPEGWVAAYTGSKIEESYEGP